MIPGNLIQGQSQRPGSQYSQSNQQNPPPSLRTNQQQQQQDFQQQNRRFGQNQGFNNQNQSNFQHQQGGPQSHFSRGPPAESQNSFNSRFNPPDRSTATAGQNDYQTGRGASNSSFGGEMFQRREREQRPSYDNSAEYGGGGRQNQWSNSLQGPEYQDEGRQSRQFTSHQSAGRDSYSSQPRRGDTGGR